MNSKFWKIVLLVRRVRRSVAQECHLSYLLNCSQIMIDTIRPYLELIYFITGGPVLAVFAFLALKQITVAKETSKIASQRDAYRLASEQVKFFINDVIPAINEFDQLVKKHDVGHLFKGEVVVENGSIKVKREKVSDADMAKLHLVIPCFSNLINRLEAFSVFFVSGVAAESVAYSSVGTTFERNVRKIMPVLIAVSSNKTYESLLKLYVIWHQRNEKEKLELQNSDIKAKLASIQDRTIMTIGQHD